jgi:FkbM family methyltransferase
MKTASVLGALAIAATLLVVVQTRLYPSDGGLSSGYTAAKHPQFAPPPPFDESRLQGILSPLMQDIARLRLEVRELGHHMDAIRPDSTAGNVQIVSFSNKEDELHRDIESRNPQTAADAAASAVKDPSRQNSRDSNKYFSQSQDDSEESPNAAVVNTSGDIRQSGAITQGARQKIDIRHQAKDQSPSPPSIRSSAFSSKVAVFDPTEPSQQCSIEGDKHHPVVCLFLPQRFHGRVVDGGTERQFLGESINWSWVNARPTASAGDEVFAPLPFLGEEYWQSVSTYEAAWLAQGSFVHIELGANYGRWVVKALQAAKVRSQMANKLHLVRGIGVEGEPGHYRNLNSHFETNGFDPSDHTLIEGVIWKRRGKAKFPAGGDSKNWRGQAVGQVARGARLREVESYKLSDIIEMADLPLSDKSNPTPIDLIDFDIQGAESTVLADRDTQRLLADQVKRIHVGVHVPLRNIDGPMKELGWYCLYRYPMNHNFKNDILGADETGGDGTTGWLNPKFYHKPPSRLTDRTGCAGF